MLNNGSTIQRACEQCGVLFTARRDKVAKGLSRFCSNACAGLHKRRPLADRFWEKVDKTGSCWLWTGAVTEDGYGRIWTGEGLEYANRVAYRLTHGCVPPDLEVCHACDVPACVNPDHLFLGTHLENMQDCAAKGRNVGSRQQPKGEESHNAKLTADQVRKMREVYSLGGITQRQLSVEYGISQGQVCDIINRKRWGWL